MQRAFEQARGFQCGWCTPGFVLAAKRLLEEQPHAQRRGDRRALAGNLCRCGSYVKIIEAVLLAAGRKEEA